MKIIATIPTYNEAENIENLIKKLLRYQKIEIAVFDDNSPDGTWRVVERISKKNKRVCLILRKTERGRGSVEIAMMKYALQNNADFMIEMDADLSHDPRHLKDMIEKSKSYDIVVGSRKVVGGSDIRGDFLRHFITYVTHLIMKNFLGVNLNDPSSGYRCFSRKALSSINFDGIVSKKIAFMEVIYACAKKNLKIYEIPIIFKDRKEGKSKLVSPLLLMKYVFDILRMRFFSTA